MSENNNKPELISTDSEVSPAETYDFDFIVNALGLIPYQALNFDDQSSYQGAFNPGAVINLEVTEEGHVALTLHGGEEILMSGEHVAAFEKSLKQKIAENQAKAREAMLAMGGGVPPGGIIGLPTSRRFKQ